MWSEQNEEPEVRRERREENKRKRKGESMKRATRE